MKIVISILIAIAVILCLIHFYLSYKRRKFRFSFEDTMGKADLPIVSFTQDGKCFKFLIDSGASISVLNSSSLANIECIELGEKQKIYGIDGNNVDVSLVGVKLYSQNHKFVEIFQVCEVPGLDNIKKDDGIEVVGILGNSFLKRYSFIIDFKRLAAYSNGNENKTENT